MTETRLTSGGVFTPTLAIISADQDTILGDGTVSNPIRLSSGGESSGATLVGTLLDANADDIGATVRLLTSGFTFGKALNSSLVPAQAIGIVTSFDTDTGEVTVTTTGEVTLTTAQWDTWTGGSGGLTAGAIYYVDDVAGFITSTATVVSGQFVAQVGIGRSATVMLLSTLSVPVEVP
jgi:hypothetical protein